MTEYKWFADKKFRATVEKLEDYCVKGIVEVVTAWDETEEAGDTWEYEPYLGFYIKWDECCHIWFGQPAGDKGERDGYLHLCDRSSWEKHCQLMKELFDWSVETIPHHITKNKTVLNET